MPIKPPRGPGRPRRTVPLVTLTLRIDPALRAQFWRQARELSGPAFLASLIGWRRP